MENFEVDSADLFSANVECLPFNGGYQLAVMEDGYHFLGTDPNYDFWVPVPTWYATIQGALAAVEVLKVWENGGNGDLPFSALYATPAWAALVPYLPASQIGVHTAATFNEAAALNGEPDYWALAWGHYQYLLGLGVAAVDN